MKFNPSDPLRSDPSLDSEYPEDFAWGKSAEGDTYYAWAHSVSAEIELSADRCIEYPLGHGATLQFYPGPNSQEMLYRLQFKEGLPNRILYRKPLAHTVFWSFGVDSGPSCRIKKHYQDRYLTIIEWVDKASFLAVLRQQHYINTEFSNFWSR